MLEELLARPGLDQRLFLEQYGRVKVGRDILAACAPGPAGADERRKAASAARD